MRVAGSALIAYYYFDFTDAAKRDVRGLLASLLMQLVHDSTPCFGVLSKLYRTCRDGSEQPSDAALSQSLKDMLRLPEKLPIFLIVDALDECPNDMGPLSARKRVLNVMRDFVRSHHSNLHIFITSRPEQDIQSTLNPLIPASSRIYLHEEPSQREDIKRFIRAFVHQEDGTQKWREEDKELIINKLSQRAGGM
jgi:hypothetical protein